MSDFAKDKQLFKAKKTDPKKMDIRTKKLYIDFLRDKSGGICQITGCNNQAQDWEHPKRGIYRDDRETILICRQCHQVADQPNPKQIKESRRIKEDGKRIAKENYEDYTNGGEQYDTY